LTLHFVLTTRSVFRPLLIFSPLSPQLFTALLVLPLLIALGVLFCWHVYLVLHNKTTIEVNQSFQP
jgi:hypothetical protein